MDGRIDGETEDCLSTYAPIGCDTQRGFMKWSRTSYDSKKEHSRTGENEKGIQNPQVWSLQKSISKQW